MIYVIIKRGESYGPIPECYSLEGYFEKEDDAQSYCDRKNVEIGHDITSAGWIDNLDVDFCYYEVHPLECMSDDNKNA